MQGREGVRWDRGPTGPATESLWLRHGRRLASAALGITASSIWRTQLIKNEEKTEKEKKETRTASGGDGSGSGSSGGGSNGSSSADSH